MTSPFYIGWFLSPVPSEEVCTLATVAPSPNASGIYNIGYEYVPGLGANTPTIAFIQEIAQNSVPNGRYCLWSYANYRGNVVESESNASTNNNAFVFPDVICYGPNCAASDPAQLKLYPVPTQTILNISLPSSLDTAQGSLTVVDSIGRTVWAQQSSDYYPNQTLTLDVSSFANGNYFVVFNYGNVYTTAHFVKVRE